MILIQELNLNLCRSLTDQLRVFASYTAPCLSPRKPQRHASKISPSSWWVTHPESELSLYVKTNSLMSGLPRLMRVITQTQRLAWQMFCKALHQLHWKVEHVVAVYVKTTETLKVIYEEHVLINIVDIVNPDLHQKLCSLYTCGHVGCLCCIMTN